MGTEVQSTDFQTKVLDSIQGTADDAYQAMLDKKAKYEAAKKQLGVFEAAKQNAYTKFKTAKQHSTTGKEGEFIFARAEYNSVLSNYTDADNNVDILRDSLLGSIFYSGKMNNSAAIANATLG